jgi:hypothetical protein
MYFLAEFPQIWRSYTSIPYNPVFEVFYVIGFQQKGSKLRTTRQHHLVFDLVVTLKLDHYYCY